MLSMNRTGSVLVLLFALAIDGAVFSVAHSDDRNNGEMNPTMHIGIRDAKLGTSEEAKKARSIEQSRNFKNALSFSAFLFLKCGGECPASIDEDYNISLSIDGASSPIVPREVSQQAFIDSFLSARDRDNYFSDLSQLPTKDFRGTDEEVIDLTVGFLRDRIRPSMQESYFFKEKIEASSCYWTSKGWVSVRTLRVKFDTEKDFWKFGELWKYEKWKSDLAVEFYRIYATDEQLALARKYLGDLDLELVMTWRGKKPY